MSVILDLIEKVIDKSNLHNIYTGIVTSVKTENCVVEETETGNIYFKVNFSAVTENTENKLLVIPKKDTTVVFGVPKNGKDAYLISCSEVEKVIGSISQTKFEVDDTGYKIESNGENLKKVLNDLILEINKIVVLPDSGTTPNIPAITLIQQRLNNILK